MGTLASDPIVKPGDDVVLRFSVTNPSPTSIMTDVTFLDELTDGGSGLFPDMTSGFLPYPVSVTFPPSPDPPCGAGSSLALGNRGNDGSNRRALELTGGSLASGATCTFSVTVTIPADMALGTYLNTTEEPTGYTDGATRTGNATSDTLTILAAPQLTKEFTDDPVAPGNTVTLEFSLSHSAGALNDATDITFTDDLDATLSGLVITGTLPSDPCGSGSSLSDGGGNFLTLTDGIIAPGGSCTFSVTLEIPGGAAFGTYANTTSGVTATVESQANITSNPASDDLTVAGLVFSKEFLDDPVIAGMTTTLRFTIENISTADATITLFTDNLGGAGGTLTGLAATGGATTDTCGGALSGTTFLTYVGGSVLSGTTCIIEVPVLVPVGAADGTYLNTTSSLVTSLGTIDPATDELEVKSELLQLTKTFTDDPIKAGNTGTLEFTLTNLDATRTASNIAFTDDLNAALSGMTLVNDASNVCNGSGSVTGAGSGTLTFGSGTLAAGASCTFTSTVQVPGSATEGFHTNTTSQIDGEIAGLAVYGSAASADLQVGSLGFVKGFTTNNLNAGGTVVLTFTIKNEFTQTAVSGLTFTDDLDAVISGLVATDLPKSVCNGGTFSGSSTLTLASGSLSASTSC
ncbi:MAG: hypothetical protein GY934_18555, partial [Gammaproteobacteria bacterium]|nr:hypothetical protein [Gammaproteobacteria bacterium]